MVSISALIDRTQLQYISDYDGESPEEVSLWQTRPLADRLPALLGPDYALFMETIASAKTIEVEGDSVSIISENDSGRVPNATFQADIEHNSIHVRLFSDGKFKKFSEDNVKHFKRKGIAKLVTY
jgi:hypothetical protein